MMKKTLLIPALLAVLSAPVLADEIKIGVILGYTGPIESLTPDMASGADLAFSEVSESGKLLGGRTVVGVRGDSTCIDSAAASSVAERLITVDAVAAIMGADCSGVTIAIANNVAIPNGVVMISPSATSPALSTIDDNGLFFRTAPSDARQGQVLADVLEERGIDEVAITYTNNDYGKGLAQSFGNAFRANGGRIPIAASHEDGKADYSAEVGALAASGAEHLVVFGYVDQGGKGIIQSAVDVDAFSNFVMADGMIGESLIAAIGTAALEGSVATQPGGASGVEAFLDYANSRGVKGDGPFVASSYDASALLMLAMQAAGSADRATIAGNVLSVANAPGEEIGPGELAKALQILADGGEINYQGATNVELNEVGEVYGTYKELEMSNGEWKTVHIH